MTSDPLREQLRLIVQALEPYGINLIVGGGYGLLLRAEYIQHSGVRTRFTESLGTGSTSDLDIFLGVEVITDVEKTLTLRDILTKLGYKPIPGHEFWQFVLPIEYAGLPRGIKIDLLAAPVSGEKLSQVKQDVRRIRPKGAEGLHARNTPEALTVENDALPIDISVDATPLIVYVPHPFSYLLLKLFALRDRLEDPKKGPYHAFDIYRTVGMMTDEDWDVAGSLRDRYLKVESVVQQACELVKELFSNLESAGVIQLRIHARTTGEEIPEKNLIDLLDDLHELLPSEKLEA